jgi:hypothetical protein
MALNNAILDRFKNVHKYSLVVLLKNLSFVAGSNNEKQNAKADFIDAFKLKILYVNCNK